MNVNPYHKRRRALSWLTAALMLATSLNAAPLRTLEFSVYAQQPLRPLSYPSSTTEGEFTSIFSHPLSITGPYSFQGGNRIDFYHPQTHALEAQVQLPENSDQWLLVFAKNPDYRAKKEQVLRYRIFALDQREQQHPADQLIFLNLSGYHLNAQINQERLPLPMGPSQPAPVNASAELQLRFARPNQPHLLGWLKNCQFSLGKRHLLILFPPVLRGSSELDVRQLSREP